MMLFHRAFYTLLVLVFITPSLSAADPLDDPLLGSWSLKLPDGNPAWLRFYLDEDEFKAELLWSVGSAKPTKILKRSESSITLERKIRWKPFGESDNTQVVTQPLKAKVDGDKLTLVFVQSPLDKPTKLEVVALTGKRMPPMPAAPDLSKVKFSDSKSLFNGRNLEGWQLTNKKKTNGWRAEGGVLINETPKQTFAAYGDYGNLCTIEDFEDFQLTLEYNVPKGGNSGVYLRGMYEAQVVDRDSRMQGIQGPGALFGRIIPKKNAGREGGQWNRYDLTLVDRHITITLNGKTVIDNQPLLGCTGGGISSDDTKPGPIFFQGDHTSVQYRNINIRKRIK